MHVYAYNDETHTYYCDCMAMPSVSQIIREAGYSDYSMVDEIVLYRAMLNGTAVHRACQYSDQGRPDEIAPSMMPYVEAWRGFVKDARLDVGRFEVEVPLYDPVLWFAGTPDRVYRSGSRRDIIEIKTGQPASWHGLQTAGYALLRFGDTLDRPKRYAVYLGKDGKYKVQTHIMEGDYVQFIKAVKAYNTCQGRANV